MTELQTKPARHPTATPCATATCGSIALERNLFFTGKLLTARHFRDETEYLRSRIHLHNRLFVGKGVVCGLRIVEHDLPDCRSRWVMVRSGLAIDCCGREVVLPKDERLEIVKEPSPAGTDEPRRFVVCIRYREDELECVPVLDDSCACTNPGFQASRVREVGELQVLPLDDTYPEGCWPNETTGEECRGCDDPEEAEGGCLEADCHCGGCVPIGVVAVRPCEPIQIEDKDPPGPVPAGASLTHITGYSWEHGVDRTFGELLAEDGELRVTFNRKLRPIASGDLRTGINPWTFVVQYAGPQLDLEYLEADPGYPHLDETGCTAIFRIPEARLKRERGPGRRQEALPPGTFVLVTLRCDFLLDCRGQPVDGNHLRGRPPTGDGVPGGTFESWFTLVDDGGAS